MTLRQPNIERMLQLGLSGMAEALGEQRDVADIEQLGFDDRLAMLIEREAEHRDHRSYLGHLRQAPTAHAWPTSHDVDCRAGRGIARTTLTQLATGDWIRQALNLIVEGQTGSGKTFLACRARPPSLPPEALRALPPRPRAGLPSSPAPAIPVATTV